MIDLKVIVNIGVYMYKCTNPCKCMYSKEKKMKLIINRKFNEFQGHDQPQGHCEYRCCILCIEREKYK